VTFDTDPIKVVFNQNINIPFTWQNMKSVHEENKLTKLRSAEIFRSSAIVCQSKVVSDSFPILEIRRRCVYTANMYLIGISYQT